MIIKVQRSLFPRDENVLMYNEDKTVLHQAPMSDHIRDLMGDDMKGYYNAEITEEGVIAFDGTQAGEQSW